LAIDVTDFLQEDTEPGLQFRPLSADKSSN
jgi:hypothetical protein